MVAVVLVIEVVVVAALVGVVLVALARILETHFVTCTVWWWLIYSIIVPVVGLFHFAA